MKIAVVDTGTGGQVVLNYLKDRFSSDKSLNFQLFIDEKGTPYGNKSKNQIMAHAFTLLDKIESLGFKVVVIACHTLTLCCIDEIRQRYPKITFVGFEPAVKMAKLDNSKTLIILATNASKASAKFRKLLEEQAADKKVLLPDCSDWASRIDEGSFDVKKAASTITSGANSGTVVLACTHYFSFKKSLEDLLGSNYRVISPLSPVADQLERLLTAASNCSPLSI